MVVSDGLDWVRVFGYGLEIDERDCTWAGSGWERLKMSASGLKMSGSGWKWVTVDGNVLEWVGVDGSGWEQVGVGGSRWK